MTVAAVVVPLLLLGGAAWALHRQLAGIDARDLRREIAALPRAVIGIAGALTALDYLLLSGYDLLALRWVGRSLPYGRVVLTSFIAYAFSNNLGSAMLSSGAVRFRLYAQWGLAPGEIARVVAFTSVQLWAGLLPLAGVALLAGGATPLPGTLGRAVGVVALALTAAYLAAAALGREYVVRGVAWRLPSLPIAAAQVLVSAGDWALAALVLYVLLPSASIAYPSLLGLFVLAQVAGIVSNLPGGVGVFDAIVLAALAPTVPAPIALSALLVYRVVYYVLPFVASFALLAATELVVRRESVGRLVRGARASFAPIVPWLAAGGAMVAGVVLLVSGATPALPERLHLIRQFVPLPLLEASHLVGSLGGTALLLVARGLSRRLDGAWVLAVALLAVGAGASLVKGLDFEEAALLGCVLLALLPFRGEFYRRSSLLAEPLGARWLLAVGTIVGCSVAVGLFAFRHVEYSHDLWFKFAFHADASRYLRASVTSAALLGLFALARLLSPKQPAPRPPGPSELRCVRDLVDRAPDSAAHLALLGDKSILFSPDRDGFLMYGVAGRSWVAMGDPVGPERVATELAWRFREAADRHGAWACFYEVGVRSLPRYLDLGLSLVRLGEEAVVPLAGFSLEGPGRRPLRLAYNRALRDGLAFEVAPPAAVPLLLPRLREISDAWLVQKNVREKGFSLGYFDERYLSQCPVALVRHHRRIVAFANVWTSTCREELSMDLMRHAADAPGSTMDFLLTSLMLWGAREGYRAFNLGMAPLSGFEDRALAPLWTKLGARLFQYGEHFYNFRGLRQYKEKFAPEWRPRYLAAPGGLRFPIVLTNVAALVSRGLRGVVAR